MSGPLQSVHLRVGDKATGKAVPVRLRVTDQSGVYFAPLGRLAAFDAGACVDLGGNVQIDGEAWAYIDGACEILLPPGLLRVRIAKGPEYVPLDVEATLAAGKLSLRFELTRRIDLAARDWHSGDVAAYDMTPHAAQLEGAGEGLAVVNLLVRERRGDLANVVAFSGQKPILEQSGAMVAVNSRNDSPLGRLCLLHCHRAIFPLSFELGGDHVWTLDDWCQQCHRIRQRPGLVVAENYFSHSSEFPDEMTALLALGHIDAILFEPGYSLDPWFTLLDAGLRVPLVAGSRRTHGTQPLGVWRTYAQAVGAALTYSAWIEAVRTGRTWITAGPLVTFDRNVDRTVRAELHEGDALEILSEGEVLAQRSGAGVLDASVPPHARWALAQVKDAAGVVRAITSPVYFDAPPSPRMHDAALRLEARLRKGEESLQAASDKQRAHLLETLRAGALRLASTG